MKIDNNLTQITPFLLRFSERLPSQQPVYLKYDPVRQVSLQEIDGQWVDATSDVQYGSTRLTKIKAETTDDD